MPHLTINKFSCIDCAQLDLSDLTILIGPQASGKSVISKLIYFFYDAIDLMLFSIEDEEDIEGFSIKVEEKFKKWFPPGAWGEGKFTILFQAGQYKMEIRRPSVAKSRKNRIEVIFSEFFAEHYERTYLGYKDKLKKLSGKEKDDALTEGHYDLVYTLRRHSEIYLQKMLGRDFHGRQIFIPAGRSFFTSMGKAVVAFEQGGILDPVTIQFGRLYTSLRDRSAWGDLRGRQSPSRGEISNRLIKSLFGGVIRFSRDQDYLEADDGRIVPFSFLSSGQQEVLPLWVVLDHINTSSYMSKSLIYIEEPEAHLFPSAQGILTEYIASIASKKDSSRRIIITTHSPYLLAKANNLLKAGKLAKSLGRHHFEEIGKIIPREAWVSPSSISAYALVDGSLHSIMDEDNLIDAAYLDNVSGDISDEFYRLLELEPSSHELTDE